MEIESELMGNWKFKGLLYLSLILAFLLFGFISFMLIMLTKITDINGSTNNGFIILKDYGIRTIFFPTQGSLAGALPVGVELHQLQAGIIFGVVLLPIPAILLLLVIGFEILMKHGTVPTIVFGGISITLVIILNLIFQILL